MSSLEASSRNLFLREVFENIKVLGEGKLGGPYKVVGVGGRGAYNLERKDKVPITKRWNIAKLRQYYAWMLPSTHGQVPGEFISLSPDHGLLIKDCNAKLSHWGTYHFGERQNLEVKPWLCWETSRMCPSSTCRLPIANLVCTITKALSLQAFKFEIRS